jgi:2-keto-4-pentenoate hydratase/2-oxohepta-3-ene-1,7-dioic acid hydratase in catechol pathway
MKIFAIGMNYAMHNKELHGTLLKTDEPVIFLKADTALLKDHKPSSSRPHGRIEYETEVVVRICKLGKTVPVRFAPRYYDAVTVGIDFTARELQKKLSRTDGRGTWPKASTARHASASGCPRRSFSTSSAYTSTSTSTDRRCRKAARATCSIRWTKSSLYISQFYTLKTGDILYTGTPAGVGPVHIDDHLEGWLEDREVLEFNCK